MQLASPSLAVKSWPCGDVNYNWRRILMSIMLIAATEMLSASAQASHLLDFPPDSLPAAPEMDAECRFRLQSVTLSEPWGTRWWWPEAAALDGRASSSAVSVRLAGHCRSRPISHGQTKQKTVATGPHFPRNCFIWRPMSNLFVLDLYVLLVTDTH